MQPVLNSTSGVAESSSSVATPEKKQSKRQKLKLKFNGYMAALHLQKKMERADFQLQEPVSQTHHVKIIEAKEKERASVSSSVSLETSTPDESDQSDTSETSSDESDVTLFSRNNDYSLRESGDTLAKTGEVWTKRFGTLAELEKNEPWMAQIIAPYQDLLPKVNPLEPTGTIFMGGYPGDNPNDPFDLGAEIKLPVLLKNLGINQIVCLQKEDELPYFPPYRQTAIRIAEELSIEPPEFLHFGIRDLSIAEDQDVYDFVLKTLLPAVTAPHKKTYIHCWGGNGRTGTISSIVLASLYGLDAETALKKVNTYHKLRLTARYNAPETDAQKEQVRRLVPRILGSTPGSTH